jgi:2-methylisocitrate lyase-like PEP mutase family enzyme
LHNNTVPLHLPNCWDAGSARLLESEGGRAIATTSAGLAWSLGYRDGRELPRTELLSAVGRIARVLSVPLSVDIENGYSDDAFAVAETVAQLADLGVAGINIEDGSDRPEVLAAKIVAIRRRLDNAGIDLFINARSDVYLAGMAEESKRVQESISRATLYMEAGADGIFLPGLHQPRDIKDIVDVLHAPLNVMAWPGLPNQVELGKLGVRRFSAGSAIAQVVWATAQRFGQDFMRSGASEPLMEAAMPYGEIQGMLAKA